MPTAAAIAELAPPQSIHSCPSCSHWLTDGTLACPDCNTLTYGSYLHDVAAAAHQLESEGQWAEARGRWQTALSWLPPDSQQAISIHTHLAEIDARTKTEEDRKARWTKRLGPFAPIGLFLLKAKSFFFLIFKFKFLLSFLAYFALYWALCGWQFAVGLTISIFIHEMGHYVAVKRRGLKADLPMFLPGLGAYVRWYGQGVSREDLAQIALAGPLFGLGAALVSWGIYWQTHSLIFLVVANVGACINVLNLVPILGLDGAQATYALSRLQRALVAATCVLFFGLAAARDPFDASQVNNHFIFLLVAGCMVWRCFTSDAPEQAQSGTFVYFLSLFLALGLVLQLTPVPGLH